VKGHAYQVKLGIYSKVHCQRAISFLDRKVIGQNEGGGIKNMEAIDGSLIPGQQKGTHFKTSLSGASADPLRQPALTYLTYDRVEEDQ
jgi:hypothetical protein